MYFGDFREGNSTKLGIFIQKKIYFLESTENIVWTSSLYKFGPFPASFRIYWSNFHMDNSLDNPQCLNIDTGITAFQQLKYSKFSD